MFASRVKASIRDSTFLLCLFLTGLLLPDGCTEHGLSLGHEGHHLIGFEVQRS